MTGLIWLCSTSSNTQVIRNYSPQSGANGGDFDFLVAGPWHDPVLTAHLPSWASLQMAGGHNSFRLHALVICDHCPPPPPPAQGECRGH